MSATCTAWTAAAVPNATPSVTCAATRNSFSPWHTFIPGCPSICNSPTRHDGAKNQLTIGTSIARNRVLNREWYIHIDQWMRPYPSKTSERSSLGHLYLLVPHRCRLHESDQEEYDCLICLPLWDLRDRLRDGKAGYRAYKKTLYGALFCEGERLIPLKYKRVYSMDNTVEKHRSQCIPIRSIEWLCGTSEGGAASSRRHFIEQHWTDDIVPAIRDPARVYCINSDVKQSEMFKHMDYYSPMIEKDCRLMFDLLHGWRESLCQDESSPLGRLLATVRSKNTKVCWRCALPK